MKFTANTKELIKAIKGCAIACAAEDSPRKNMMYIELDVFQGLLTITALDGFRMIQKRVQIINPDAGTCCVQPKMLLRLLDKQSLSTEVSIECDCLMVVSGDIKAFIPLLDGQFIQHRTIWPDLGREKTTIWVNARYLVDVVKTFCGDLETIAMEIPHDVNKPILITQGDDRALVLPVRHNL